MQLMGDPHQKMQSDGWTLTSCPITTTFFPAGLRPAGVAGRSSRRSRISVVSASSSLSDSGMVSMPMSALCLANRQAFSSSEGSSSMPTIGRLATLAI